MTFDLEAALDAAIEREKHLLEALEDLRTLANDMRATLSHEIKTPLAVIAGAADLLNTSPGRLSDERKDKLLEAMTKSVQQIESLAASAGSRKSLEALEARPVDITKLALESSPDVEVQGAGTVWTHHPELLMSLVRQMVSTHSSMLVSQEGEWVLLQTTIYEGRQKKIMEHLVEMLGGNVHGAVIRLPVKPLLGGRDSNPQPID